MSTLLSPTPLVLATEVRDPKAESICTASIDFQGNNDFTEL